MFDMAEYMDGETFCYVGITLVIAVSVYKLIAFYFSAKQQNRRVKIRLNFISIQNNQAGGKENVCKLLAAVIENYPQLVKNADHNETVDIEAAGGTIYLVLSQGPDKVIDLDHVMDHIRYCIQSITEDPSKCIELMKVYTGPNFKASIEKMRMEDQNNAELDIISDPPIKTHSNLVIWPSEYNPQKWMECFKKSNSVIHSLEQYKDSLEKKGFNGIRKTNKKNIEKMLNLDMIHPGDGLYLVRKKLQYAHVAIVTDTKSKKLVHATKTSIIILRIFREFGKIVEEIFDKVVKQEDECFVVRHQHKKLTGQHIAERASTLAIKPALTFTYDVIDANCEVVFNAAAGIFKAGRGSPQGQLVGEPYSDPRKKMIGRLLGWLQKSADIELLAQMYFRLDSHDMLYESEPGQQVKSIPESTTDGHETSSSLADEVDGHSKSKEQAQYCTQGELQWQKAQPSKTEFMVNCSGSYIAVDEKMIAVGTDDSRAVLLNAYTGAIVWDIECAKVASDVQLTMSEEVVTTVTSSGTVTIWDRLTRELLYKEVPHGNTEINGVAAADNLTITGGTNGSLAIMSLAKTEPRVKMEYLSRSLVQTTINHINCDKEHLLVGTPEYMMMFNITDRKRPRKITCVQTGLVFCCILFYPFGASVGYDGLQVWDMERGVKVRHVHKGLYLRDMASFGNILAVSEYRDIYLFDWSQLCVPDGQLWTRKITNTAQIEAIALNSNCLFSLVKVAEKCRISVWDFRKDTA